MCLVFNIVSFTTTLLPRISYLMSPRGCGHIEQDIDIGDEMATHLPSVIPQLQRRV